MEHEKIKISNVGFSRNSSYTKYKDDSFMQNLERLLIACMLKDYDKTIDGIKYTIIMDDMVLWINDNDRHQEMFLTYLSMRNRFRTDNDWIYNSIAAYITNNEVRNMAWLVEYLIINNYDIKEVGIDKIYELWKTDIQDIFGDIDDDTLNRIKHAATN